MEGGEHFEQATALLDGCISQLLELIATQEGWEDIGDNDGVRGSQRITPDGRQIIRAVGILNFSCEEITSFIWDYTKKKSWDGMLDESSVVKSFSDTFRIQYERFTAPWPVSYRDFVFAAKIINRDDGILLVAKSINANVPEQRSVVRAEVVTSGFVLKRVDANTTEMTYLVCVDLKGSLPGFIVKQLGKSQAKNVNKIRHVMNKARNSS